MNKGDVCVYMYLYVYIYLLQKSGNHAIWTTQMDLEGIMLDEISQTDTDKCCMVSHII